MQLPFPRRNLDCLLLLALSDKPQTTGALMDGVASLCQSEDLPDDLWRNLNGNRVRGKLDSMVGLGLAKRGPVVFDPAKGRPLSRWVIAEQIPEQWRQSVLTARGSTPERAKCAPRDDMTARVLDMCDVIESIAATLRRVYGGAE